MNGRLISHSRRDSAYPQASWSMRRWTELQKLAAYTLKVVSMRRDRATTNTGWVVTDARSTIPRKAAPGNTPVWQRWWIGQSLKRSLRQLLIVAVALQFVSLGLLHWPWNFWNSLEPHSPGSLQAVLWQVEAGLVAVALPVFFIVVQHSASLHGDVGALPVTEVLRRETGLEPTLGIAALGFIRSGADSIWFQGSAVLFCDFFIVFCLTIILLGHASYKLFQLAGDATLLKQRAEQLLQWKLRSAIDESWAFASGNEEFLRKLKATDGLNLVYSPVGGVADDVNWIQVFFPEPCEIIDIRADQLIAAIKSLPGKPVLTGPELTAPTSQPGRIPPDGFVVHLAGEHVTTTMPFVVLNRSSFGSETTDEIWALIQPAIKLAIDND